MDTFFFNSLSPWQWAVMGGIPPALVALYFLKLKRQPLEVPSTYLWHRVIEDLHVNSLWQKLRRSLLLFLQLLVVGLAMAALLRPGWRADALVGKRFIFMLDNSASMSATDVSDTAFHRGPRSRLSTGVAGSANSRLELAKQHAAAMIDRMTSDMSAMIVTFAEQTQVVQPFTSSRKKLREALQRISPTAGRTHLRDALELASGFANPERITSEEDGQEYEVTDPSPVELVILSDGRFDAVAGFSLGNLRPQYLPIGSPEAANLAITGLSVRSDENRPGRRQVFVQVANFSDQPQRTVIDMSLDGKLVDAVEMEISAEGLSGVTFSLGEISAGVLRARLEIPSSFADRLQLDNTAHAALNSDRVGRVLLITPGNSPLELALATERVARLAVVEKQQPEFLQSLKTQQLMESDRYDLMIFDQCVPVKMPHCNTLTIGRIPPLPQWQERSSDKLHFNPQIVDWQRAHPLLNLVELGNVQIADTRIVQPPPGGKILVDSTLGPILAIAPRDQFEDVVLGFEIVGSETQGATQGQRTVNTNWPRRYSFPNFWLNVMQYLASGTARQDSPVYQPGEPVELSSAILGKMPVLDSSALDSSALDTSALDTLGADPGLDRPDRVGEKSRAGRASEAKSRKLKKLKVVLPDGASRGLAPPQHGIYAFHETYLPGIYQVFAGKERLYRFAVNLLDPNESDIRLRLGSGEQGGLRVVDSISIGYVDIEAQVQTSASRREFWKWLLLAALVVLVIEWYIFNRRVYL